MKNNLLETIQIIDRKINYEKLFVYAGIIIHALGLFLLCAMFAAYTQLTGFAETWAKLPVFGVYCFVAFFGADGLNTRKTPRFAWATVTNFIIVFTF